jgi:hypothetical protein
MGGKRRTKAIKAMRQTDIASRESSGSPYAAVDYAELEDGSLVVIEAGDGQVSGLATAQAPVGYYRVLADRLGKCG